MLAGVFGMNTSDIRNMNDTQWLFWATAVPLCGIFSVPLAGLPRNLEAVVQGFPRTLDGLRLLHNDACNIFSFSTYQSATDTRSRSNHGFQPKAIKAIPIRLRIAHSSILLAAAAVSVILQPGPPMVTYEGCLTTKSRSSPRR